MFDMIKIKEVCNGLWDLFSLYNGNPSHCTNYGIQYGMGIFFSFFLFYILKMRAISTMKKEHIVALIGALFIFFRYIVMFVFEYGYQIKLYDNPYVYYLFPPIEHFFYGLGLGCISYYTLNFCDYYPGMLKKILYFIPFFITAFFIYATIAWTRLFHTGLETHIIFSYNDSMIDYQSHIILFVITVYSFIVMCYKKELNYLTIFWLLLSIDQIINILISFDTFGINWLITISHAIEIWTLPILTLHFIKRYVNKLKFCGICRRFEYLGGNS